MREDISFLMILLNFSDYNYRFSIEIFQGLIQLLFQSYDHVAIEISH